MKSSVVGVQLALCVLFYFVRNVVSAPVNPEDIFTEKELSDLKERLTLLDKDDGMLTVDGLRILQEIGCISNESDMSKAIVIVDEDHNGKIDLAEFLDIYAEIKFKGKGTHAGIDAKEKGTSYTRKHNPVEAAFKAFGGDIKGFLYGNEIRKPLKYIRKELTDNDIDNMMWFAGLSYDNKITLEEFKALLGYGPGSISGSKPDE